MKLCPVNIVVLSKGLIKIYNLFNGKIKTILYLLGSILIILSFVMFIPFLLSLYLGEGIIIYRSFLIPSVSALTTGFILSSIKIKNFDMDLSTSMIICGLGWFLASFVGAMPFYLALEKSFIDTLFEAVSGFTTTGITVFQNLDQMPASIILWRSLTQWLGGLGILTFFLFVTFRAQGEIWQLFTAESHKINTSRLVPNIFKTIKILWVIYIGFTLMEILLLCLFQVSFFDAVIHSMTTLSTGGFSNYDSSIGYFQRIGHPYYRAIEYIFIFFMLMGGINFMIHFKVFKGNLKELFFNGEMKYFWGIITVSLALILMGKLNDIKNLLNLEEVIRKTLFQVVSVMTTTGYETQHIGSAFFPTIAKQLFLILMLVGGCVGSTAGGVKVVRIAVLNKLFFRELNKFHLPKRAIFPVTLDKKIIPSEEIQKIVAIFFGWLIFILVGGAITALFSDLTAYESYSGILSAVSNIGPFYFSVEKMASLSPVIKFTFILGMLAGRLEILPVLILFTKRAWR